MDIHWVVYGIKVHCDVLLIRMKTMKIKIFIFFLSRRERVYLPIGRLSFLIMF